MNPFIQPVPLNAAWLGVLKALLACGQETRPRGQATLELPQVTVTTRLAHPVLTIPERHLNHRFMAGEAHWILNGDDRVSTIAPYNSRIAAYSDDGVTFFGAYGPRYVQQLPGVVQKLMDDPASRQAGLTLWRPNPPATKDVPCTVAVFFQLRDGELNVHVFMRSSDAWLGLPYDVFNFSMMGYEVVGHLNQRRQGDARGAQGLGPDVPVAFDGVAPGALFLTMASSHLYEPHFKAATEILEAYPDPAAAPLTPSVPVYLAHSPTELNEVLNRLRQGRPGPRWWV